MIVYHAHFEADHSIQSDNVDDRPGFKVISTYEVVDGQPINIQKFYTQSEYDTYVLDQEVVSAFTAGRDIIAITFNPVFSKLPDSKQTLRVRWSNKKYAHGWTPR